MALMMIIVIPWNSSGQSEFLSASVFGSLIALELLVELHPTVVLREEKLFFMVEKVGRKWMMGDLGSTNPTIGRYSPPSNQTLPDHLIFKT